MRLYNTLTRQKEAFQPLGDPVSLYVCGVTPYDTTHLGHARTYLVFDVLHRYLVSLGMSVRYVQNVTDVDDPLFAKAKTLGVDYRELGDRYTRIFLDDLRALNVQLPTIYCRVSDEIERIINIVETLIERDMAYVREGWVFFRAGRLPSYGSMSRLSRAEMAAALRETGEDPADPRKEDPLDFRLWQPSAPGEPRWDSRWGAGRPGWHIECSSMASHYLGSQIDIHGGGADLVFPHHCSEIAQSESATGLAPFVRYWVHVGLVAMEGDKMSKSKGNLAFVRDLLPSYGSNALRYYLLATHYREPMEYFERSLSVAAREWGAVALAARGPAAGQAKGHAAELQRSALAALDDDLDIGAALRWVRELAQVVEEGNHPADRATLRSLVDLLGFRLD